MAERWKSTITNLGLNMLANVTDERPLKIVRMACASGSCAEAELRAQTSLTNYVMDIPIVSSGQLTATLYEVKGLLDNADIKTGFNLRQIGVFAKLGNNSDEVLYQISQLSDGEPSERIPAAQESPGYTAGYSMDLVFSSATNIEVVIDGGSLAEAKEYTDEKVGAVDKRLTRLESDSGLIFSDTIEFSLAASAWERSSLGYYEQTIYPDLNGTGATMDYVRGTIGLARLLEDDISEILKEVSQAKIQAKQNGANGIKFMAFGKRPAIDIPVGLNLEYDGSGKNVLISAFPVALEGPVVSEWLTADIPAGDTSIVYNDVDFKFDISKYTYNLEIMNVQANEGEGFDWYNYPVLSALNIQAKKVGFKLFTDGAHNDTVKVRYRIVGIPL